MNSDTLTTLALSDGLQITFNVITLVITSVALFLGFTANRVASRYDRLEDDLKKRSDEAIEQRFKLLHAQIMGRVDTLVGELESTQRRLGAGDRLFKGLQDRDHQDEMKTLTAIEQLRREVIERMATKAELGKVQDAQRKLETKVAAIKGAA